MELLASLDAILTLSGNRLSGRLWGLRIGAPINWINRILFVAMIFYYLFTHIIMSEKTRPVIAIIQKVTYLCTGLVTLILVTCRRRKIIRLLETIDRDSVHAVRTFGMRCFAIAIGMFIVVSGVQLFFSITQQDHYMGLINFMVYVVYNANNYMLHYSLVYLIVLKIITDYAIRQIREMQNGITQPACTARCLSQLKHLSFVQAEFERIFNFIPFVLFGVLFLTIPSAITEIMRHIRGAIPVTFLVVFLLLHHVTMVLMIVLIVRNVCKSRESVAYEVTAAIEMIYRSDIGKLSTMSQLLIDSLKSYRKLSFTGWYLFTIDQLRYPDFPVIHRQFQRAFDSTRIHKRMIE